jgi:hypothetical protein
MKDAQLLIQKPRLMVSAVNMIDALPLTAGDTKGDLYEYLLSKLTTAGINGQFRTPRHIIRLMVDLVEPKPTDVIGDPACGTGGFLVSVIENLRERFTSEQGKIIEAAAGTGSEPLDEKPSSTGRREVPVPLSGSRRATKGTGSEPVAEKPSSNGDRAVPALLSDAPQITFTGDLLERRRSFSDNEP